MAKSTTVLPANSSTTTGRDSKKLNDGQGGCAPPSEKEEDAKKDQEGGARNTRHRRRARRAPRANRSRSSNISSTSISSSATPASGERVNAPPAGSSSSCSGSSLGRGGGSGAGSAELGGGRLGRVKAPGRSPEDENRTSAHGLSAEHTPRKGVRRGNGTETGAGAAPPPGGVSPATVEPGQRRSTKGCRARKESTADPLQQRDGGVGGAGVAGVVDGMETVSLTTSVEVTVLNGMSMGEDGGGSTRNGSSGRQEPTTAGGSGGGMLPALKQQQQPQQRRSMAKLVRTAGAEEGAGGNAEAGKGRADKWSPVMAESSVCVVWDNRLV